MPTINELPGIEDAMQMLDAAEQAETAPRQELQIQAEHNEQQPAQVEDTKGETPTVDSPDTPAAAEAKTDAAETTPKTDKPAADDKRSHFSKDAQRRDTSWKALNAEKENHRKEVEAFKQRMADIERREQEIAARAAKAERKFTPEQYEEAATQRLAGVSNQELQADGLEARANQLEIEGKYAEADRARAEATKLRQQAGADKVMADRMKAYAEHLRKNPDPTLEQIKAQKQQQTQFYTVEAAKVWPDLAKSGSQFQKDVAASLQEAAKNGLDVNEHPVLIYHAANLVAYKAAAARVPGLEKTIGELQAKVKELEMLTSPGGGTTANLNPTRTATGGEDTEETLRAAAEQLG